MFVSNRGVSVQNCEPGVTRKILNYTDAVMMVEVSFEKGTEGYLHSHPHLQITYVAGGSFEITIAGETRTMKQGDSVMMPPNSIHGVKALEEGILVDVFNPKRDEFIRK